MRMAGREREPQLSAGDKKGLRLQCTHLLVREQIDGNLPKHISLNSPIQRLRPHLVGPYQVDGDSNIGQRNEPVGVLKSSPRKDVAGCCKTDRQAQHEEC